MKKLFQIVFFFLIPFSVLTQERNGSLYSKNSWSLTVGTNIIYPAVDEYREVSGTQGGPYPFYSDFIITPSTSVNPVLQLAYNRTLFSSDFSSILLTSTVAYRRDVYKSIAEGSYYGDFTWFEGSIKSTQIQDNIEASFALNGNFKFKKYPIWCNQLGMGLDLLTKEKNIQTKSGTENYTYTTSRWDYYPFDNVFLFYQTGITFKLTQHLHLTPTIRIPFLHINKFWEKSELEIYQNLLTGFTLTIIKNKKH